MLKKITNWIRSKVYNGYKEPSIAEITDFLKSEFTTPNKDVSGVRCTFYTVPEMYQIIYKHFGINPDMLTYQQRKFLKDKMHVAFHYLDFPVVNRKISYNKSLRKLMLIKLNP